MLRENMDSLYVDLSKSEDALKELQSLTLLDDDFMTKIFEDKACVELSLQIILQDKKIRIVEVHTQHLLKNLHGRSIYLDVYAEDDRGYRYNIEVQRKSIGANPKRLRFHAGMLDMYSNVSDKYFKTLKDNFVIFITEKDIFNKGKGRYYIDKSIRGIKTEHDDHQHIMYVNSRYRGKDSLGKLMHDFCCCNPDEMYFQVLADQVRKYKMKGGAYMGAYTEKIRAMAIQEGRQEGRRRERYQLRKQIILNMLKNPKLSYKEIASYCGVSVDQVTKYAEAIKKQESSNS